MASPSAHLREVFHQLDLACRSALAVLVPPLCVACESRLTAADRWLCSSCRITFSSSAVPRSRAIKLAGGDSLTVRYALSYTAKVSKVITEMKYSDKPGLASILAPYLFIASADFIGEDAVLVPVPMHPSKKRERGYNQSELLSGLLARAGGWTSRPNLLVKKRNTASQTTLQREARPANVSGSVGVRGDSALNGRHVVIVDDVVTTGSTLVECAKAIRELDAGEISACVVASSLQ